MLSKFALALVSGLGADKAQRSIVEPQPLRESFRALYGASALIRFFRALQEPRPFEGLQQSRLSLGLQDALGPTSGA